MKAALCLGIALLTFLGITKAATPDPKAPQILVEAKFINITERDTVPSGGAPLPAPLNVARKVPGPVGILTDPQFQVLIRGLGQRKGVELLSTPTVTTRAGQQAKVEALREMAYKDEAGKPATKNTGVTLTVLPKVTAGGQLDLDLFPQIVECVDFVFHKNGWEEPIFLKRQATERAVLASGQTIVLELAPTTDRQTVVEQDKAGSIVSSRTDTFTRRTLVFVTAHLVDPATGKPRVPKHAADPR